MMNTAANPYDSLYNNLKSRFTVVHDGNECTVGDYMLIKAGKAPVSSSIIPVRHNSTGASALDSSVVAFVNYMNEKLTVKRAPVKDRTIRRFPMRTSVSAMLSAVAACALIMSCGLFALRGISAVTTAELPSSQLEDSLPEEFEKDIR